MIRVNSSGDENLLKLLDLGAEDVVEEDGEFLVYTKTNDLAKVRDNIKNEGFEIADMELTYVPNSTIEIKDKETAGKIMRLMDALDELDDVSNTFTNFEIDDSLIDG